LPYLYSIAMGSAGAPEINDAFGAIAHPLRRRLVSELATGPKRVSDLAGGMPVSRPAVSQHLRLLLDLGLVSQQRVGREHYYRLHPERLEDVRQWLYQLDDQWRAALARLGEHLMEDK
jgi:DNA-binding transcriptional ArsR family regulator